MTKKETDTTIIELGKKCLNFLDDKKADNPVFMDLRKVNSYLNYFIIATGNSKIHCRSLARELERFAISEGLKLYGNPDYNSEWIIIDFGEIIAHIFTEEMRSYYQLEKLWADAEKYYFDHTGDYK
ncbi:MAG TPA: ribosome silencing factor [Spirochaetota bacterium]|nr:ribosome silencing factor [Spirochaetota bacterium]HPF05888.1 ribosome silencing factor [Spirochaetota bacterium]HPJ40727.1 ribosome silencing factor [Spirochaetota bacterium]HPR35996.1 ribosome silencing factor [Spirochaetota bacterium]HRX45910.1 ribosome silencing factor [Spirochaetota bacterium]